jgi:hypothetical protein
MNGSEDFSKVQQQQQDQLQNQLQEQHQQPEPDQFPQLVQHSVNDPVGVQTLPQVNETHATEHQTHQKNGKRKKCGYDEFTFELGISYYYLFVCLFVVCHHHILTYLGMKRKVTVNEFNGFFYVNIREFYMDKNGAIKPGNKGIALTFSNWDQLFNQVRYFRHLNSFV